jgi:hypothetical protein
MRPRSAQRLGALPPARAGLGMRCTGPRRRPGRPGLPVVGEEGGSSDGHHEDQMDATPPFSYSGERRAHRIWSAAGAPFAAAGQRCDGAPAAVHGRKCMGEKLVRKGRVAHLRYRAGSRGAAQELGGGKKTFRRRWGGSYRHGMREGLEEEDRRWHQQCHLVGVGGGQRCAAMGEQSRGEQC